jgi:hypothetical protein
MSAEDAPISTSCTEFSTTHLLRVTSHRARSAGRSGNVTVFVWPALRCTRSNARNCFTAVRSREVR